MAKKSKKIWDKVIRWTTRVVLGLFVVALFSIFWDWISDNAILLAIITGAILLIFLIFGLVSPKKVRGKLKKRFTL